MVDSYINNSGYIANNAFVFKNISGSLEGDFAFLIDIITSGALKLSKVDSQMRLVEVKDSKNNTGKGYVCDLTRFMEHIEGLSIMEKKYLFERIVALKHIMEGFINREHDLLNNLRLLEGIMYMGDLEY